MKKKLFGNEQVVMPGQPGTQPFLQQLLFLGGNVIEFHSRLAIWTGPDNGAKHVDMLLSVRQGKIHANQAICRKGFRSLEAKAGLADIRNYGRSQRPLRSAMKKRSRNRPECYGVPVSGEALAGHGAVRGPESSG